jgi:tetratricopeptide (TPR) repeat protein
MERKLRISRVLLFILLVCQALPTFAEQWTDQEIKVLPAYCMARLKHLPGQYEYWSQALGPDFLHTHHYCDALAFINRYYSAPSAQTKTTYLQGALGGLNYMISHASQSYSLMPEVYLNRGIVMTLLHKEGEAVRDFLKAIELNPKFIRGYIQVSDLYTKLKRPDEALKVVTEGLRHNPGNAALQQLYQKSGGKLPYPEPIKPEPEKSLQAPPAHAVEPSPVPADTPPSAQAKPSTPADASPPANAKIGTPSNPWCRFCPEPTQ